MKELNINFSDMYSHIIYFAATSYYGDITFLVSENFEARTSLVFSTQRLYFNLNYILDLKEFKMDISK